MQSLSRLFMAHAAKGLADSDTARDMQVLKGAMELDASKIILEEEVEE